MAARILTTRLLQASLNNNNASLPIKACLSAKMSSAPTTPGSSKTPATVKADVVPKRDSLRSKLALIFGGNVDPADPKDGPISADEIKFPDMVEKATGQEKLYLLAFENGILDPLCNLPVRRNGRGKTKDDPIPVETFGDHRIVACCCEPMQNSHRFMTVYKGEPKRCNCGHWIALVDAPRFWEKIPKEDLIEIQFFRELHEEGKLDDFLATGKLDENDHRTMIS